MDYELSGTVSVVTGASGGIGRAITDVLLRSGSTVACLDLEQISDDFLHQRTDDHGSPVSFHTVDVTSMSSCQQAVAEVLKAHGRIDYLVNNAGVIHRTSVIDTSESAWARVMDVNLGGTFRMCQSAFTALRSTRGAVVNIGSTNGYVASNGSAPYCVSKAGVMHLTRVLGLEWAADGVRANAVAPTVVETAMTADVLKHPGHLEGRLAKIPLRRLATAEDVANGVAFLLSGGASMITGEVLFIDGGATIH